jgi:hypothetical protein
VVALIDSGIDWTEEGDRDLWPDGDGELGGDDPLLALWRARAVR